MRCEYYKLNGPNSSPICFGTKECEPCSCNGDKSKCNFNYFLKEQSEFRTLLENYNKLNTQCIMAKIKLEEATKEHRRINNEYVKASQAIKDFKEKIDYDKLRKAVINSIFNSVPSLLFDLISDKIYELCKDEIFNLALQMEIDCSDFIKGE